MRLSSPEFTDEPSPMEAQLQQLRKSLATHTYPVYPKQVDRLVCSMLVADQIKAGIVSFPDGPWQMGLSNETPDVTIQSRLRADGYLLDSSGRPLHPWFSEMAADESIGVVGGRGAYWNWGPNKTADSVVLSGDHVLLIQRGDTGLWALPGGYVDGDEPPLSTAARELHEETGLLLPLASKEQIVYSGIVSDLRATAHAWPETTAVVTQLSGPLQAVRGIDDAIDAAWVPIQSALTDGTLFGAHHFLLTEALRHTAENKN